MLTHERLFSFLTGKKRHTKLSPTQIIAIAFAVIILTGGLLLTLPIASRNGESSGFLPALFTSTSATCVTGLILFDTWVQWSGFGQVVILCLIEIGGLGFMTALSLVIFLFRRKVGLRQRMVIAQALSLNDMQGVVRLQKLVLIGSVSIQLTGAVILFLRFLPRLGLRRAVMWGVFHSISAFCNAGFDIMGYVQPGAGMMLFQDDPVVCLTIMALITLGGLGFFVWEEVVRLHSWKKFSVYTKLVLLASGTLIFSGAFLICLLEWNNPATLGPMPVWQKILNGFFQSVTVRTCGFASVDQAGLTDASKAVSTLLMLTGGSSGSTAGGVKTVTVLVALLFAGAQLRGKASVCVFKRSIAKQSAMDAMTILLIMAGLGIFGGIFISATCSVGFTDAVFEAASALGTVGLTAGVTTSLTVPAQILIIIYMYFGRVGVMTISLGFMAGNKAEERYQYAHTNLLIG